MSCGKGESMRRIILGASLFVVAACGNTANPNVCCATTEQCTALGFDELRPCGAGQACGADNACVAAECEVNADCDDAVLSRVRARQKAQPIQRPQFRTTSNIIHDRPQRVHGRTWEPSRLIDSRVLG